MIIKCKMCGGDLEIAAGSSVAECEYCGSRQTIPSADSEKKMTLFARASRLLRGCEFDKAAGVFESIVADFPEEAEAYWGLVLCKYGIEYVDDPATGKKIPTCHRSSFESVMDDKDFDLAVENADAVARKVYRDEAKQIEELRRGIVAVSANEEPYDVFICYKETDENGERTLDSVLAQDIYEALTGKGYRTFFARISLEDKLGLEYEPYIFAALNSAKVMLAIGTDYEYFNAVWVKNEWSRFLKLMTQDKSKHLIPCYKGIDAYDMPKEFARLQAQDLGKVGAVQDLLRGIDKLIGKAPATTVVTERVVVGGSGNNKIASLLDRGNMALEDGDWAKADSFFEDVLNNDSKNAQAYLGKTLAEERCRTIDAFARKRKDAAANARSEKKELNADESHIAAAVEKYAIPGFLEEKTLRNRYDFDLSYLSAASARKAQYEAEQRFWAEHKLLSRAEKFAAGAVAENLKREKEALFAVFAERLKKAEAEEAAAVAGVKERYAAHLDKADKEAEALYADAVNRREERYQDLCAQLKHETELEKLRGANGIKGGFLALDGYKDSEIMAQRCVDKAKEIEAEQAAEAERQRVLAAKKAKEQARKNKRNAIIFAIVAALGIAAYVVYSFVLVPGKAYKEAEALLATEDYVDAAFAFAELDDYRDSKERSFELWNKIAVRRTISAGNNHTVGLKSDGTVVAKGDNTDGQCNVDSWSDIVTIAAGGWHTVGLKTDGTVVAVGRNNDGQCDTAGWADIVAISAGNSRTIGLKSDGTVVAVGRNDGGQCDIAGWTDIVAISTGTLYTVGLKSDGTAVSTEYVGNLAYPATVYDKYEAVAGKYGRFSGLCDWTDLVEISAGGFHAIGLKSDGAVAAAGGNSAGQCMIDNWTDIVEVDTGYQHTVGLKKNGTVVATGVNEEEQCDVSDWSYIVAISTGDSHTVGLKADGTVVAAGKNDNGQCDVDGWTDIKTPTISEEQQRAMDALTAEKELQQKTLAEDYAIAEAHLASGDKIAAMKVFSELGEFNDAANRARSIRMELARNRTCLAGGGNVAYGVKSNGTVVAAGLQNNDINISPWKDVVSVSAAVWHAMALHSDGTVSGSGQVRGDVSSWKNIIAISASDYFSLGLTADGTVKAVGTSFAGVNMDNRVSDWTDIVSVAAGTNHAVGLKSDGTVVAAAGAKDCYGAENVGNWTDIVAIAAGQYHTVGLRSDGTVIAVGKNNDGSCHTSNWTDIVAVSAGASHTVGLRSDGTVVAVGSNNRGQCNVSSWTDIVAISTGSGCTLGLRSDGTVVAVGSDADGVANGWRDIKLPG